MRQAKEHKHKVNTNNIWVKYIFSIIMILVFSSFIYILSIYINDVKNSDGNIIITADSLLTTSTITLIVFTNFSPSSSPSGSLMRRAY